MSTFNVTRSTLNYEFKNGVVIVTGSYSKNVTTDTLQSISGSVYNDNDSEQGDDIGNFNGYMRDGEIRYSLSEMSRKDSNKVWDAIDEIEVYVLGENE